MKNAFVIQSTYPNIPNSLVALYWIGISISAARAKAVSFSEDDVYLDMISVKLTNCQNRKNRKEKYYSQVFGYIMLSDVLKRAIPENYQIHEQGSCHQISSYLPRVHHQHQQEQLREDDN